MVAVMTANNGIESGSIKEAGPCTLVVGLGASGLAAARYLARLGEPVVVIDSRAEPPGLDSLKNDVPDVTVEAGTLDPKWLNRAARIVLSPGLPVDLPLVAAARERGIDVIGELELFARAADRPVLAVTGSNGKSTVTSLAAALLGAQGIRAPAGGNLGPAALDLLGLEADAYVIEVSSFQLETTTSLAPVSAAVLNVSPDHIDRHGSLEHYAALKASLLKNAGHAIVNRDDPLVRDMGARNERTIPFSVREPLPIGWSVVEQSGERWLAQDLEPLIRSADLGLPGETGEANSLAALALAVSFGADRAAAVAALPAFRGLPHRLQLVREVGGVRYIDDSKGTNVGATIAALTGDSAPAILIAGGQAKGADFAPLAEAAAGRVRAAILIGEAAGLLEEALAGRIRTIVSADLSAAVAMAASLAEPGDRVLLSPACASQDMFADYRERGRVFAAAVEALE
jgi:UDP-N-acetylmuramoylalanine--D-glutamate ligase